MLLTIQETAKVLKVTDRHVRRMIAIGKYPFYRVGNRAVRLDLDEIKAASRGNQTLSTVLRDEPR